MCSLIGTLVMCMFLAASLTLWQGWRKPQCVSDVCHSCEIEKYIRRSFLPVDCIAVTVYASMSSTLWFVKYTGRRWIYWTVGCYKALWLYFGLHFIKFTCLSFIWRNITFRKYHLALMVSPVYNQQTSLKVTPDPAFSCENWLLAAPLKLFLPCPFLEEGKLQDIVVIIS